MKTIVIVPAYNEQENIRNTLRDLAENAPGVDVLVMNDCSTDGTEAVLKDVNADYLSFPVNLGIGGGVQAGYRYAKQRGYDIAIQFDGDGQHEAKYLQALIDPLTRDEADIVIGSRFIEHEGFQSSGARRMGIGFLSRLIHLLCGVKVRDVTSGMRAVNRKYIEEYAEHYARDYPEPEAILYAGVRKARITEVPVQMRERENGKSSIGAVKSIYYMIKVSLALMIGRFVKS